MTTNYYPDNVPTAQTLRRMLNTHRKVCASMERSPVDVSIEGDIVLTLPWSYRIHIQRFVWREEAIRLVLDHTRDLKLSEDLADNLKMLLCYMDNVFKRIVAESKPFVEEGSNDRNTVFDKYLRTEYLVRRHEPMKVREWKRENDTILEDGDVDGYGKCSSLTNATSSLNLGRLASV